MSIKIDNQKKKRAFFILAFCFFGLATFACGGFGLLHEQDLSGKYAVWIVDREEDAAVVKKTSSNGANGVLPAMIFAYGWNDQFIIAKQHPPLGDSLFVVDINKINWFIIEVASGTDHGPLTEQEYIDLRQKLGVPDSLIFTEFIEPSDRSKTPTGK